MKTIMRYSDYVTELHSKDYLFDIENDKLIVDAEKIAHEFKLTVDESELALDQNPDDEHSDFNYELTIIPENSFIDYDHDDVIKFQQKIENFKQKHSEYIENIKLDNVNNVLVIRFKKNIKVQTEL